MSFPKYPAYKDSGVEWIGKVPVGWSVKPFWTLFRRVKRNDHAEKELLSIYRDYGVIPKSSRNDNFNKPSDDLAAYQLVKKNDLVINKMKAWQGSCAVSDFEGIVSPAYFVFSSTSNNFGKFLHYLLRCDLYISYYYSISKGVRPNQWDLDPETHSRMPVILPSLPEQQAIASFLDRECGKIDALIAEQERLIALLAEKRQAVISHAVTKGLNPNAPMKDSGIPWIGMVPEGWEVVKLKHIGRFFGGVGFPHEFQGNENLELGFYKVGDLGRSTDGVFMSLAQHTVTCETAEQLKANVIPKNSILYAKIGAALLLNRRRISPDKCCIDNNMTAFVPNIPVHVKWSFWWLSFIDFSRFVKPGTVPSLSEGDQKEIAALLPPDRELDSIIEYIEANVNRIDLLEREISRGISISKERRAALISAAVTGKIDVRAQSKAIAA